jgi:HEAT repeat protein
MPQLNPAKPKALKPSSQRTPQPDAVALDQAFNALRTYREGSSRAALLPIDEAILASLEDKTAQKLLEQRLRAALQAGGSVVAREFACAKLALLGSERAVKALAAVLDDPHLSTAARNALEAIATPAATRALRKSLARLTGLQKVGVIHSLGARRDAGSVRALTALLRDPDVTVAGAAAAALGDIGSTSSARALQACAPNSPRALRPKLADAALVCAERLHAMGRTREARDLCQSLDLSEQPKHVRQAVARRLALASAIGRGFCV